MVINDRKLVGHVLWQWYHVYHLLAVFGRTTFLTNLDCPERLVLRLLLQPCHKLYFPPSPPPTVSPSTMGSRTDPILENNTPSQSKIKSTSPKDIDDNISKLPSPPFTHSPVPPLAPLEYLQNQQRGSITDPALHAASSNIHPNTANTSNHNAPRPASPYAVTDAMTRNRDHSIQQNHRGLHSPSYDEPQRRDGARSISKARDHAGLGGRSITLVEP